MNEQETTEDIIAEMCAREDLDGGDMVDNFDIYIGEYGGWDALKLIKAYADRLDAAHKRECVLAVSIMRAELYGIAGGLRALTARSDARQRGIHYSEVQNIAAQIENIADNGGEA